MTGHRLWPLTLALLLLAAKTGGAAEPIALEIRLLSPADAHVGDQVAVRVLTQLGVQNHLIGR